jgi:hypothetical protein
MQNERRIAPRTELRAPLPLRIAGFEGRLRELSTSGARIEHRERLVVGARVNIDFKWDGSSVQIAGSVIRSEIVRRDGAALVYHSGVQFEGVDAATENTLEEIIFNADRPEMDPVKRRAGTATIEPVAIEPAAIATPPPVRTVAQAAPAAAAASSPFMAFDDDDEEKPFVVLRLVGGRWSKEYADTPEQPEEGLTIPRDQLFEIDALQRTYETADPMTREMMRRAMAAQLGG